MALLAAMARRGGVVTRRGAADLGVSPSQLDALVRRRLIVALRRGVYCEAELWDSLDEWVGRPRLRARAAVAAMQRGWVLSHDSAAHELGLAIVTPDPPFVHVTRPGFTSAWTRFGVKHHLAPFRAGQVETIDGMRVLGAARTAVDIARERGFRDGAVACDSAMRLGVAKKDLIEAYAPMANWPGVTSARAAVDFADAGAESVLESLGRQLVAELGVGDVETQFPVRLSTGTVWADLRVGNHLFECDGKIKLLSPDRGGVATDDPAEVIWQEKRRERLLRGEGLGVSRILFEDTLPGNRRRACARLAAEYAITLERHGPDLPEHLARFAAQARAERGSQRPA